MATEETYVVERRYYETNETSRLGVYATVAAARLALRQAVEYTYDRERDLGVEDVRARLDRSLARCPDEYDYYDATGFYNSCFTIRVLHGDYTKG